MKKKSENIEIFAVLQINYLQIIMFVLLFIN